MMDMVLVEHLADIRRIVADTLDRVAHRDRRLLNLAVVASSQHAATVVDWNYRMMTC